jgi:AraC-like DNA-binding protein
MIADKLDGRLSRVVLAVFENPTLNHTLGGWARTAGATERTLARLFRRTFGMTFLEWRQRILMDEALRRLQVGEPVTVVALDLGYSTPSAFSHAFHKATGVRPSQSDLTGSANRRLGHEQLASQRPEVAVKHTGDAPVLTRYFVEQHRPDDRR